MTTNTPLVMITGETRQLPSGNKLGGITGGAATGEAVTQDQLVGATVGQVLTANGPGAIATFKASISGNVVGPSPSTTNSTAVFADTTGKLLRSSPTVVYYPVASGTADKVLFGATFGSLLTATDGATVTFDFDMSNQWQVTLAGNRTLAFLHASIGQVVSILRYQDGIGNRTTAWWSNITWSNGFTPVDDLTANGWSLTKLICVGLDSYGVPKWKELCRTTSSANNYFGGNVGIGTILPIARLHVKQATDTAYPTLGTTKGSTFIGGDNDLYGLFIGSNTNDGNTWAQVMRNDSAVAYNLSLQPVGGKVGIGTTAPARLLDVVGTFGATGISTFGAPIALKGYTVATLPTGVVGYMAYVTDALAPTYGAAVVGGGAIVTPVFYNGSAWTAR